MADDPRYRLRIDSTAEGGQLTVAPALSGPAGANVRYEVNSTKVGKAGKSVTRQGGKAMTDDTGAARLSTLRLGILEGDRYEIVVKVYEGQKLVAQQALTHSK